MEEKMNSISMDKVNEFVNERVVEFHNKRIQILLKLTLPKLIDKNPYLFRAKNINLASELIENTMSAFLSSSEEKVFGDFLEDLAIYIASITVGGHKSSAQGIDLEFINENTHFLISIKSGANWGNSSQHKKMEDDFKDASRRIKQSSHNVNPQPTLGICYGKNRTIHHKNGYLKIVGQNFWTLISGYKELYKEIIEPIGYHAKEHNSYYENEKGRISNLLTAKFVDEFCNVRGEIDWPKLVQANSGNYDLDGFNI
jgi:hypothetical protein